MSEPLYPLTITPRQALLAAMATLGRTELDVPLRYAVAFYSPPEDAPTRDRFCLHTPSGEDMTLTWRLMQSLPLLCQAQGTTSCLLAPTTEGGELGAMGAGEPEDLDTPVRALRITLVLRPDGLREVQSFAEAVGSALTSLLLPEGLRTPLIVCCERRPTGWPP